MDTQSWSSVEYLLYLEKELNSVFWQWNVDMRKLKWVCRKFAIAFSNPLFKVGFVNASTLKQTKSNYQMLLASTKVSHVYYEDISLFSHLEGFHCWLNTPAVTPLQITSTITYLEIDGFDQPLTMILFPPNLRNLVLPKFNQLINPGDLPPLVALSLPTYTHPLVRGVFREGLQVLCLRGWSGILPRRQHIFPSSLEILVLCTIPRISRLPRTLKYLEILEYYGSLRYKENRIPPNLKILKLPHYSRGWGKALPTGLERFYYAGCWSLLGCQSKVPYFSMHPNFNERGYEHNGVHRL